MSKFFNQDIINADLNGRRAVTGYTSYASVAGDNDDGSDDIIEEHRIALVKTENYLEDGELYTRTTDHISVNEEELDNLIEILKAAKVALAAKNKECAKTSA